MTTVAVYVPQQFYRAGDPVDAHIVFDVTKQAQLRELVVEFYGRERAQVSRTEHYTDSQGHMQTRTRTYTTVNTLVLDRRTLIGRCEIQPGRYEYDVRFQIPPNALPTFHSYSADITYSLSARGNIKWGFDARAGTDLTVVVGLPSYNPPTPIVHTSKYFGYGQQKAGMQIRIDDNTIARGSELRGTVAITPGAKPDKLRAIDIEFYGIVTATAQGYTDTNTLSVSSHSLPLDDLTFRPEMILSIPVPPNITPTFYGGCTSLRYYIKYNLDIAWGFDRALASEIVVL